MDSRRPFSRWPPLLWAALMCAGAALAGWQHESPRLVVLALLLLTVGLYGAFKQIRRLMAVAQLAAPPPAPAEPARSAELVQQRLLRLDALLEHAPVALWQQQGQGQVAPLNIAARRLVAPGGARDSAELLGRLAQHGMQRGAHSLFSYESERGSERCLLASRELVLNQQPERLLALMPIESELEAETLKAWRQLVHVLTHEIMNSLTPISSLSRTARELLAEPAKWDDRAANQQDLTLALDTIARRADALASFVGNYRRVSELPEPRLEPVRLSELLARLEQMAGADWTARGGAAVFTVEPASLTLMADAGQLEQALLNLIKNAAQACAVVASPRLSVRAKLVRGGRLSIEVRDNGPGVPPGLENDIFLPFFSTKPLASPGGAVEGGQGIGLAVVRNLIHGMGGSVRYVKPVSGGAAFVLSF